MITWARAMANYHANAPTNPCLRSQIPLPSHGDSKNGPLLPSPWPHVGWSQRSWGHRARLSQLRAPSWAANDSSKQGS